MILTRSYYYLIHYFTTSCNDRGVNDSSIVGIGYRTLAEPITMRTQYIKNIEDKVTMSGLYKNNHLILLIT